MSSNCTRSGVNSTLFAQERRKASEEKMSRSLLGLLPISMLFFICFLGVGFAQQPAKMKIILASDIGDDIDNAWALAFLISHQKFQPLGVTISHGNTPARMKIACKLLHITGRSDIPVAVGRKTSDGYFQQYTWAEDFTAKQPIAQPAADFIVEQVKK